MRKTRASSATMNSARYARQQDFRSYIAQAIGHGTKQEGTKA